MRSRFNSVLVVALLLIIPFMVIVTNFVRIFDLQRQVSDLNYKIEQEKETSSQLDESLKQIGTKTYTEMLARKYLGLYYPDEKIVIPTGKNTDPVEKPDTPQEQVESVEKVPDKEPEAILEDKPGEAETSTDSGQEDA